MTHLQGINYSAIDTYYRCPKRYQYQFIDKIPTNDVNNSNLHFGTAMHVALQAMFSKEDYLSIFNMYWDSLLNKDIEYSRFNHTDLSALGTKFLERFERLHLKYFTEITSLEKRLYSTLDKFKVEGTPDCAALYKGIPSIIDFKTSSQPYTKDKIIVNEQMPLYAYLLEKELGYKAEQAVYIIFCKTDGRIQVQIQPLTESFMAEKLDNLKQVCHELEQKTFFTKNRNGCLMGSIRCPYFERCYGAQDKSNT